jgi:hypothetical protein
MSAHGFREVSCHISDLRIGDTVKHGGNVITVGRENLKRDNFMGLTLCGDSYRLGAMPVIRLVK